MQQIDVIVEAKTITVAQKVSISIGLASALVVGAVFSMAVLGLLNPVTTESPETVVQKFSFPVDTTKFQAAFTVPSAQTAVSTPLNKTFTNNAEYPLNIKETVKSFSLDGQAVLQDKNSFVRVVLVDQNGSEHLVYQAGFPFEDITSLNGVCEETCVMDPTTPASLRIELSKSVLKDAAGTITAQGDEPTASFSISTIHYLPSTAAMNAGATSASVKQSQEELKVASYNTKGAHWIAGETAFSQLSYAEKKAHFGGQLPNLCGFEYYQGGYFEFCDKAAPAGGSAPDDGGGTIASTDSFSIDWRTRHGQNWMTSVKNQGGCSSCWAFGAVGTVEAATNAYFNQHLDLDLSEQDILSCSGSGNCSNGYPDRPLNYFANMGVVTESCFPYSATNGSCGQKCSNWQESAWKITGWQKIYPYTYAVKQSLLTNGPLDMYYIPWHHVIVLAGFGEVSPGTYRDVGSSRWLDIGTNDSLIGRTYWLVKNSWGEGWGENGYGKVIIPDDMHDTEFYAITSPIIAPTSQSITVNCTDTDQDGYCFWGTGQKPSQGCPVCGSASDCDDSDRSIGACAEDLVCGSHTRLPSGEVQPFGDYEVYGQSFCCGDDKAESVVSGKCCNNSNKVLKPEDVFTPGTSWGSSGTGNGQFSTPVDVAYYNNKVYTVDRDNHRIQVFDVSGNFLFKWGRHGVSGNDTLQYPGALTVTAGTGRIVVADTGNNRIKVFDENGGYIAQWGSSGSGNGQFSSPADVAAADNKVFVADTGNHRIQVFNESGGFIGKWGSSGSGNGQFSSPADVAAADNKVFVADTGNHRIEVFDISGNYITQWGSSGSGNGQFVSLSDVFVSESRVYVFDQGNDTAVASVQVFDENGNFIMRRGLYLANGDSLSSASDIALFNNILYVTDSWHQRIQTFAKANEGVCEFDPAIVVRAGLTPSPAEQPQELSVPLGTPLYFSGEATDFGASAGNCPGCTFGWYLDASQISSSPQASVTFGSNAFGWHTIELRVVDNEGNRNTKAIKVFAGYLTAWGSTGSGQGQFNVPRGAAVSPLNGYVYVADGNNNRIQVFDQNGVFQFAWGTTGTGNGQFAIPSGIAIDASGKVYIVDSLNNRIQVFDQNGNFQFAWGSSGIGNGQFAGPVSITVNSTTGRVFVSDNTFRIQVFDQNGNFQFAWGEHGDYDIVEIFADANRIYVSDKLHDRIVVFDQNGNFQFAWGEHGNADGQFFEPGGIYLDRGILYVADQINQRIQMFNQTGGYIGRWGWYGSGLAEFAGPYDVSIVNNRLYVVDQMNGRIQVYNTMTLTCSDGTAYGQCNTSRQFCRQGVLVSDCVSCGCSVKQPYCNQSSLLCEAKCSNGTAYGQCAKDVPMYCNSGQLTPKCSVCGCLKGYTCQKATGQCLKQGVTDSAQLLKSFQ